MSATSFFLGERFFHYKKNEFENLNEELNTIFCQGICINSSAYPKFFPNGEIEHIGDETECALLELAYKLGYNYENYRPSEKVEILL
jgi:hypothetical protein